MGNMSYCMFRNTVSDFEDCTDAVYEDNIDNTLSDIDIEELEAIRELYELAKDFVSYYEHSESRLDDAESEISECET